MYISHDFKIFISRNKAERNASQLEGTIQVCRVIHVHSFIFHFFFFWGVRPEPDSFLIPLLENRGSPFLGVIPSVSVSPRIGINNKYGEKNSINNKYESKHTCIFCGLSPSYRTCLLQFIL